MFTRFGQVLVFYQKKNPTHYKQTSDLVSVTHFWDQDLFPAFKNFKFLTICCP